MSIRVSSQHGGPPAPTSVNVKSASTKFSTSFLSPQDRTGAKDKDSTTAAFVLLVAVALVLLAGANIYFNYLVGPTDLPFLGQFFGP
jgi:hypothetical protein